MNGKVIALIVLVLIIAAGAWYLSTDAGDETQSYGPGTLSSTAAPAAVVTYTDQGFSPSVVTISQGGTIEWVNNSSSDLWVASDPHPLHDGYDSTTLSEHCAAGYQGPVPFDSCAMIAPGGSWAFVFSRAGTWGYHNHIDDGFGGGVTVLAASSTPAAPMTPAASTSASVSI